MCEDSRLELRAGVIAAEVGAVEVLQWYSVASVMGVEPLVSPESAFGDVRTCSDVTAGRKKSIGDWSLCTAAHRRVILGLGEKGLYRVNGI